MSWARCSLSRPNEKINGGVSVKYKNPEMEIIVFKCEDVIRTSGDDMIDEDIGGGTGDIVYPKIGTF